ncbi:hypothetical protein GM415_16410 [Pseudodesulfovibrio cashew]|uniref:DUF3574 domain-containing protein n=1 Tax=Pseudodesulfovibrio cashew TaxID=2678688 RepID=A0A6I6JFM8_9BACT|nr:hypothetical protein [Pseudodesulfovibrio cashew]QGY41636.1 hypothetical protein GM415_16410 [Pseudodesulfovibrio cashew]
MKRFLPFIFCLCLVLAAGAAQAGEQEPFVVHFVVIGKVLPDGSDSAPLMDEFKLEVLKLAGGFTELGPTRGGSLHDNVVRSEENVSFIIGAKKDISVELKALTDRLFKDGGAFIMSWPGKVLF